MSSLVSRRACAATSSLLLLPLRNVGQLADIGGLRATPTEEGATRQCDGSEQHGSGRRTGATRHERGHILLLLSDEAIICEKEDAVALCTLDAHSAQ